MATRATRRRINLRERDSNVHGSGALIVTCWYRDRGNGMKFNHLSIGFNETHEEPPYLFESQRIAWSDGEWIGMEATLIDGVVTEFSA